MNKHVRRILKERMLADRVMSRILKTGTLTDVDGITDAFRRIFGASRAEDHMKIHKYCCNAISKIVNFRKEATEGVHWFHRGMALSFTPSPFPQIQNKDSLHDFPFPPGKRSEFHTFSIRNFSQIYLEEKATISSRRRYTCYSHHRHMKESLGIDTFF